MKPKCPEHPDSPVLAARKPGEDRKQWVCLTCGKLLGDAGPRDDDWEKFTIGVPDALD